MCPIDPPALPSDRSAVDERLHRLSHDLKNRIGGALEALRGLRDLPPGLTPEDLHGFAERNLFQAMHTLERALDDLGVERGPRAPEPRPADLADIAREAARRAMARYERKQQTLTADIAPALPVRGDAEMLTDLVHALVTNASKFSPVGATVSLRAEARDGHAIVQVTDPGVGLSTEDLSHVFERYAWLASRPTGGEGQARGSLARALQTAQVHGGGIEAHSDGLGAGCTFTLTLPPAAPPGA